MDEYAAEFLRLSRFAPYMVIDKEKGEVLAIDIQMFLISQQLKTYSQVLTIGRELESGLEKRSRSLRLIESAKRTFQQMDIEYLMMNREDPVRPLMPC